MAQKSTLMDLYHHMLKDAFAAERMIGEALPEMIRNVSHSGLKQSMQNHLEQTRNQFEMVQSMLREMGVNTQDAKCRGMQGIIEEGKELIQKKDQFDQNVLDAAILASAQKVEHYEIATYGTLREYAHELGERDQAQQLEQILEQERRTDKELTRLAEGRLNREAQRR